MQLLGIVLKLGSSHWFQKPSVPNHWLYLIVLRFNATITPKFISWRSVTHMCSWLSHTSTNTNFFPKPPTTFLTCFSRVVRQKYAVKKFRLNRVSNSQPPGHESDMLTTERPKWGLSSADWSNKIFYLPFMQLDSKM